MREIIMNKEYTVTETAELESIIGTPMDGLGEKVRKTLDNSMMEFIRRSPLICISTMDENGQFDVSPKGDAPGFVQIDGKGNLLIPDRPGNNLLYGFRNILKNNNVGLIFIVPNMRETLRVKGQATLTRDPELLEELSANGKPALLCTHISVQECFFHCGKAMIRSNMWKPDKWAEQNESLMLKSIVARNNADEEEAKELETYVETAYRDNLY